MLLAFDPRHIDNEVSLVLARVQVTEHATTSVVADTYFRAARTTRFAAKLNNDFDGRGRSIKANINHMSRRFNFHFFCRVRWNACIQSNRARSPLRPVNCSPYHAKSRTQERKVWPTLRMGNLENHVFSGKNDSITHTKA